KAGQAFAGGGDAVKGPEVAVVVVDAQAQKHERAAGKAGGKSRVAHELRQGILHALDAETPLRHNGAEGDARVARRGQNVGVWVKGAALGRKRAAEKSVEA